MEEINNRRAEQKKKELMNPPKKPEQPKMNALQLKKQMKEQDNAVSGNDFRMQKQTPIPSQVIK